MEKSTWIISIIVLVVIVIVAGWYLISPAFDVQKLDDVSPLRVNDAMGSMTAEEKAEFQQAVDSMKDQKSSMSDNMPSSVNLLSQGAFRPQAHSVMGEALLIDDNGKKVLRFENFHTSNGPNLHVYLSTELGDSDFVDLGKIKATDGNVNYEIPTGTDTDKYDKVLVWCVPFRVLFSYAELN